MAEVLFSRSTSASRVEELKLWIDDDDVGKVQQALRKRVQANAAAQSVQSQSEDACVRANPVGDTFENAAGFHACLQAAVDTAVRAEIAADSAAWKAIKPLVKQVLQKDVRVQRPVPVRESSSLHRHRRLTRFGSSKEPLPDVAFVSDYPLDAADRFLSNAKDFYARDWGVPTRIATSLESMLAWLSRSTSGGKTVCLVTHALGRNVLLPLLEKGHPSNLPAHINAMLVSDFSYFKYVLFELSPSRSLSSEFPEILDGVVAHLRVSSPSLYQGLSFTPKLEDLIVIEAIRQAVPTGQFILNTPAAASRRDLEVQYERVLGLMVDKRASELQLGRKLRTLSNRIVDWLNQRASNASTLPVFETTLDEKQYDRLLRNASACTPSALRRLRTGIGKVKAIPPRRVCVRGCKISRSTLQSLAKCLGVQRANIDSPNALYHGFVPAALIPLYIEDLDFQAVLGREGTKDSLADWAKLTKVDQEVSEWASSSPEVQLNLYLDYAMVLPNRKGPLVVLGRRFTEPPAPPPPARDAVKAYLAGIWDASDPNQTRIRNRAEAITSQWETSGTSPICPAMLDDLHNPTRFLFAHNPDFAANILSAK